MNNYHWAPRKIWLQKAYGDERTHTWSDEPIYEDVEQAEYLRLEHVVERIKQYAEDLLAERWHRIVPPVRTMGKHVQENEKIEHDRSCQVNSPERKECKDPVAWLYKNSKTKEIFVSQCPLPSDIWLLNYTSETPLYD